MTHYTLLVLCFLELAARLSAQGESPTSWETDFSNPANYGIWVSLDEGANPAEFIFDYTNEEMHIAINKTSWHLVQLWVNPFNFKQSPYISFDIKTDEAFEIAINAKSDPDFNLEYIFTTIGTGSYEHIFIDFSPNGSVITADLNEIIFNFPFGDFTGELWIDNFKIGDAAIPPIEPEGTGFTLDFEGAGPDSLWISDQQYHLTQKSGSLEIAVGKFESDAVIQYDFEGVYDISLSPFINVMARSDNPLVLTARLWEGTRSVSRKVRVYNTTGMTGYCFDFTSAGAVDLREIRMIELAANDGATSFNGNLWIDDLEVGTDALAFANIGGIEDKLFYLGTKENTILITDTENLDSLTVSGGEGLIENISFESVGSGSIAMHFDCIDDSAGTDTLYVTAHATDPWEDNSVKFMLTISDNMPPLIDQAADIEVKSGDEYMLKLSGIDDGDVPSGQALTIKATSSDKEIIDTVFTDYDSGPYAWLRFIPSDSGQVTITITADDGEAENNIATMDFEVAAYLELNGVPAIDPIENMVLTPDAGEQTITLSGISDGDDGLQTLDFTVTSSADTIVPTPVIEYSGENTAELKFTPDPSNAGITTITITLSDAGGTMINNGNQETVIQFTVETVFPNPKGYVVEFTGDYTDLWSPEQDGLVYHIAYIDSGDFNVMKIGMTGKSTWDGMWMSLPEELDLSESPYISYEVYSVGQPTYHWNYFYDNDMERNIKNSAEHMYQVPADQWTLLSFDYSDPGDMQTNEAMEINAGRISAVLFNLHDAPGSWPFYTINGTVYYRNIRIGDSAIVDEKIPAVTINRVPDQVHYAGIEEYTIQLSGISDGLGGTATVTGSSRNSDVVSDPVISNVENGMATLTYTTGETTGSSKITLTVTAEGSTTQLITFDVYVNEEVISKSAVVTIDKDQTYQEIEGLGVHWLNTQHIDLFVNDLGGSVLRYGQVGNILEPVNDNDDPYVLNRDALDYSALDVDLINGVKNEGMDRVILTIFTPPAWMKRNLSTNETEGAPKYEATDNILEPYYFEEFAEHIVAWITVFKEECGIDLYAVGLQNEPAFSEPYASAVYSPEKFAEVIAVVGKRLEQEGLPTKIFATEALFYPNQYRFDEYITAINNNPDADKYTDAIATHHFANRGNAGTTTRETDYNYMWEYINMGSTEKVYWQTEESAFGNSGSTALPDALYLAGMYRDAFQFGDMALNAWLTFYQPGFQNDAGLLQGQDKTYLYYIHKHFYKYVRPGALRLESSSDNGDLLPLAFMHPEDGTYTIILLNQSAKSVSFDLNGSNLPEEFTVYTTAKDLKYQEMEPWQDDLYLLPPNSITTLVAFENSPVTIDQVDNMVIPINSPEQTVNLSGISDGEGGTAGITLMVSSDTNLISYVSVSDVLGDGTSSLLFTPKQDQTGSSKITITASDGENTRSASFYVTVVIPEGLESIEENRLLVYPNPSNNLMYIGITGGNFERLIISDLSGRILVTKDLYAGQRIETINLTSFGKGIYIVTVQSRTASMRTKFIVE